MSVENISNQDLHDMYELHTYVNVLFILGNRMLLPTPEIRG